jgi:raffinose/stachyose/melibiose transport system substrate-binding protein
MANQSSDELRALLVDELVEPLDSYLEEPAFGQDVPWKDTFLPGLLDAYSYQGHSYMIPQGLFAYCFFYNIDQFEKFNLKAPKTWTEFLEVCRTLKENGVEPIAADGTIRDYNAIWYPYLITRTTTIDHILATAAGKAGTSWTEPCYVEAATLERDLRDKGYVMRGYEASQWPSAQMQWIQGKCAMLLCATWIPKEMKAKMPDGFRMGFFPFPKIDTHPDADGTAVAMEIEAFVVPKTAKHKRAAVDFLKFITSPEESRRVVAIDIATAVKGAGMPPALVGLDDALAPPTKIVRLSANLAIEAPEWYRTVARETWSQYFLGNYTPEEMCRMVDGATKRFYEQRAGLVPKESTE